MKREKQPFDAAFRFRRISENHFRSQFGQSPLNLGEPAPLDPAVNPGAIDVQNGKNALGLDQIFKHLQARQGRFRLEELRIGDFVRGVVDRRDETTFLIAESTMRAAIHLNQQTGLLHPVTPLPRPHTFSFGAFHAIDLVAPFPKRLAFDVDAVLGPQLLDTMKHVEIVVEILDELLNLELARDRRTISRSTPFVTVSKRNQTALAILLKITAQRPLGNAQDQPRFLDVHFLHFYLVNDFDLELSSGIGE